MHIRFIFISSFCILFVFFMSMYNLHWYFLYFCNIFSARYPLYDESPTVSHLVISSLHYMLTSSSYSSTDTLAKYLITLYKW